MQMAGEHCGNSSKNVNEYEDEDDRESSGEDEAEESEEGTLQKAKQALTCRKVTLTTLMNDGIIEPGKGVLAIDYLGQRFEADLLENGKIKWHGSEQEFGTPSAWAMHCKRLVNTNNMKRSGCGWASVKYKGKKLDIWKSIWARKLRPFKSPHHAANSSSTSAGKTSSSPSAQKTAESSLHPEGLALASQPVTTAQLNVSSSNNVTNGIIACTTASSPTTLTTPSNPSSISSSAPKSLSALLSSPLPNSTADKLDSHVPGNLGTSSDGHVKESNTGDAHLKSSTTQLNSRPIVPHQGEPLTVPYAPHPNTPGLDCKRPSSIQPLTPKDWSGQTRTTHTDIVLRDRKRVRYSDLDMRMPDIDLNTLIQCESFDKHKKLQPFSVVISSNALLLMDFHCHLTRSEVAGYLGGHWDPVKQVLTVSQSFPVLCRFADKLQASVVEDEIRRRMRSSKMVVVGWYHSHPYCQPLPSIRDVDCQMAYQLQMRGAGSTYHPCVGFIEAPFTKQTNVLQSFWVMPNLENPSSLNIPMSMTYTVRRDLSLTEDILIDMKLLSEFYSGAPDRVRFKEKWKDDVSFLEKIRGSLASKLPEDQLSSGTFLDYMQQLLKDMK